MQPVKHAVINPQESTDFKSNANNPKIKNKVSKTVEILRHNIPISPLYRDKEGCLIQIWKSTKYQLIGAVLAPNGNLTIVPKDKIFNAVNPYDRSEDILQHLESNPLRRWDFAFDIKRLTLSIWPHLEAAGKITGPLIIKGSPVLHLTEEELTKKLLNDGFVKTIGKQGQEGAYYNKKRGVSYYIDRRGKGLDPNEPNHVDVEFDSKRIKILKQQRIQYLIKVEGKSPEEAKLKN